MNAFISSQFSYCPLIWVCHSRSLNARINKIHERALRIGYNDNNSSFEDLLVTPGSIRIHHRNLQILATEIYKALNNLSSSLMTELFQLKGINYNLRKGNTLTWRNIKTVKYGTKTVSYLGSKIWDLLPEEIKKMQIFRLFQAENKILYSSVKSM